MREARLQWGANRRESASQAAMAEAVSKLIGRKLTQSGWSDYESATTEPPLDVITAAAKLSGLSESYLAFGEIRSYQQPNSPVGESSHVAEPPRLRMVREPDPRAAKPKRRRKSS